MISSNTCDNRHSTNVTRRQKGISQKLSIPCPSVIANYNKGMGGVDLIDQKKTYYELDRKSKFRFYLRIFFDLMDVACVNAFQIYAAKFPRQMSLLQYKITVADALTRRYSSRKRSFPTSRPSKIRAINIVPQTSAGHLPEFVETRRRCVNCAKSKVEQRTFVMCSVSKVHLCLLKERNCFTEFHL